MGRDYIARKGNDLSAAAIARIWRLGLSAMKKFTGYVQSQIRDEDSTACEDNEGLRPGEIYYYRNLDYSSE